MLRRCHVRSITLALGGLAICGLAVGQTTDALPSATPEAVGMSSGRLGAAMDSVRGWVARERIRGAVVLVIRLGRVVLHEAAGWSDRERGIPLGTDHIVSMRSMTKPLVGTAVLMLVEEGRLNLSDRVAQYLPSFDNDRSGQITIFQLLTHTSGLSGEIYNDQNTTPGTVYTSLREAVDAVGARGPEFAPGTRYSYSDPGTSTLGALIEAVTGMPSETFLQQRILAPLGMRDSYFVLPLDHPARPRVAATYRRENGVWTRYWDNTRPEAVPFFRASGGLWSTSLDYARFMAAMIGHGRAGTVRLLDSATVALAVQPHAAYVSPPDSLRARYRFYGFHWSVITDRYGPVDPPFSAGIFEHAGSDGTLAWADPSQDLILIYLTQSRGQNTRNDFLRLIYAALDPAPS